MKNLFYFLFGLIFLSCSYFKTQKDEMSLNEYPYLGNSIEAYFHTYFSYPDKIEDLMNFIKNEDLYKLTYLKFKKNIKSYNIVSNDSIYVITDGFKKNILELYKINICEDLNDKRLYPKMLKDILFFHENGELLSESKRSKFTDSLRREISLLTKDEKLEYKNARLEYVTFMRDSIIYNCDTQGYKNQYSSKIINLFSNFILEQNLDSIKLIVPIMYNPK